MRQRSVPIPLWKNALRREICGLFFRPSRMPAYIFPRFLSSAFGIFMHTFCKSMDSANMTASPLIVLTSILGGTFYSYAHSNQIMNALINVLPQKNFIAFVNGMEKGCLDMHLYQQLGYCLILILVLTGVSAARNCSQYRPAVK